MALESGSSVVSVCRWAWWWVAATCFAGILQAAGLDRVTGDHMEHAGHRDECAGPARCPGAFQYLDPGHVRAIPMSGVVDHYDRRKAIRASVMAMWLFCRRYRQPFSLPTRLPARHRG